MTDALKGFAQQLAFEPLIENADALHAGHGLVVCGMGGSHLSADIYSLLSPMSILKVHSDYGLPDMDDAMCRDVTFLFSSYSGNTQEVLDAYDTARGRGFRCAVAAVGGALIERAQRDHIPYIQFPACGLQPRAALGYGVAALAKLTGNTALQRELVDLSGLLRWETSDAAGVELAQKLQDKIPLVCATTRNAPLAQNWKIKFNENAKIPSFWNVIPELNHNEMTGFDAADSTRALSERLHVIMLRDSEDHPHNCRRMQITAQLYAERGISVSEVVLDGAPRAEKIFSCLMLGDWTSVHLGARYGVETEAVPMVEEFKNLMARS